MRTIITILKILYLIYRAWKKNRCLRFCQLIGNCFDAGDNYNKEDYELEIALKERYNV